jgi:hypothetical protein
MNNLYCFLFYRTYKFAWGLNPSAVTEYMVAIQVFTWLVFLNIFSIFHFLYYKINIRIVSLSTYLVIIFVLVLIFNHLFFRNKYLRIESYYDAKRRWYNNGFTFFVYICLTFYFLILSFKELSSDKKKYEGATTTSIHSKEFDTSNSIKNDLLKREYFS